MSPTGPPLRPEASPGFLLWRVTLRWQRDVTEVLRPLDLTHVQFVLLAGTWWLNGQGHQPSQAALATFAGVDVKMVSPVVRTLERKVLLRREADARDSRARRLVVTDDGAALARRAVELVEDVDRALLAELPASDRPVFTRLLAVLAER